MSANLLHDWNSHIEAIMTDIYNTAYARGKASISTDTVMGCARTLLDYCKNTKCEDCPFYGSVNGTFFGCGIDFPEDFWELDRKSYKEWKEGEAK